MNSDNDVRKSILVHVDKQDVIDEYQQASKKRYAYERAVWGSTESMLGRFRWALRELPFAFVTRWLDVGCGEGDFFALAEEQGHRFEQLTGIDLTPAMIQRAQEKRLESTHEFALADLEDLPEHMRDFDFISLLGVLQKCGVEPETVFHTLAPRLVDGGWLFLTSKNLLWSQFSEGYLQPEVGHSWFNPHEVQAAAKQAGLVTESIGGLIPKEARDVPLDQSHTFFLLLRKAEG